MRLRTMNAIERKNCVFYKTIGIALVTFHSHFGQRHWASLQPGSAKSLTFIA